MLRQLLLPLAASALLAGCVTTDPYGYRGGDRGDYYYGAPSVEYRYRGDPGYDYPYSGPYRSGFSIYGSYGYPRGYYGSPYGNPYYGGYSYPYYGGYGYPYQGGYGHPHPGYPQHRPTQPPPPGTGYQPPPDTRDGGPWRNLDDIRRRRLGDTTPGGVGPSPSFPQPSFEPRPRMGGGEGGSPMGQIIRRSREPRPETQTPEP